MADYSTLPDSCPGCLFTYDDEVAAGIQNPLNPVPVAPPAASQWAQGTGTPAPIDPHWTSVLFTTNGPADYWEIDWQDGTPLDQVAPQFVAGANTRAWHLYPTTGSFPAPTATRFVGGVAVETITFPHFDPVVITASTDPTATTCLPSMQIISPQPTGPAVNTFRFTIGCPIQAGDVLHVLWGDNTPEDIPLTPGAQLVTRTHAWAWSNMDVQNQLSIVRGGTAITPVVMTPPIRVLAP